MNDRLVCCYRVNMDGQVVGPYPLHNLRRLPGFTLQTPVQLEGTNEWNPAFQVLDLKAYFANPVRTSFEQTAAPQQSLNLMIKGFDSASLPPVKRRRNALPLMLLALMFLASVAWKVLGTAEIKATIAQTEIWAMGLFNKPLLSIRLTAMTRGLQERTALLFKHTANL